MNSKKITLFLSLLTTTFLTFSQDKVVKLNSDTLNVKVINVSEYDVTFSYPNESASYTVSRNLINKIIFSSGRIEEINEPITITSEEDWQKVKLSTLGSEVKGLKLVGNLSEKSSGAGFKSSTKQEKIVEEKLKREAAKLGAHIILIESKTINTNNTLTVEGKAYMY